MRQLAEIVAFAHRLNPSIVHRDLKPANILVEAATDGSPRYRITDFGIGGLVAGAGPAAEKPRPLERGWRYRRSCAGPTRRCSPRRSRSPAPLPTRATMSTPWA